MPSSRIIKSLGHEESEIAEFSFQSLEKPPVTPPPAAPPPPFIPMDIIGERGEFVAINDDAPPEEEEEELPPQQQEEETAAPVEPGPPTVEITEEELDRRINDAFNSGLKEGKDLAERGLVNVFKTLRASSEMIHDLREKILREAEDELIDLIMMVARKVIVREVSQERGILAGVVHHAVAGLSAREEITVRLNPDDYALITRGRDELLNTELLSDRLQLRPDPTVASGFCEVDTVMGTIDANLDSQLDEVYRHLLEQRSVAAIEGS